jgi:hypothetical protein
VCDGIIISTPNKGILLAEAIKIYQGLYNAFFSSLSLALVA